MNAPCVIRENEIRPEQLAKEAAKRYEADVRNLLERKSEFISVSCPACDSSEAIETFRKFDMRYVTCVGCETMYISPRPTPDILKDYYDTSETYKYWNKYVFPASEDVRKEKIFRPRAARLIEICKRQGVRTESFLEVGAGFGTFCEEIRRLNIFKKIVAVEPTPDLAQTCRNRGLNVVNVPIEQMSLENESFDVVASFEVIEHLFSPADFVQQCKRCITPGGLLVLTCPNGKGFDIVTLKALSGSVDTEHLNYFNPESLSILVESHGFEVLEVQTPGRLDAELVRHKALTGEIDFSDEPFLRRVLIDDWERLGQSFQLFLSENGLSSHMWLAAWSL